MFKVDHTPFRYIAYHERDGSYAHFGYSPDMAIMRAKADLDVPGSSLIVVDMKDNGWGFVKGWDQFKLEDAIASGGIVLEQVKEEVE